jgi:hypothetical protein
MVFCDEPFERLKFHVFCMNFMMGFLEAILQKKSQHKTFCKHVIITPPSLMMPMIITRVMLYVKLMHKGLL